MSLQVELLEQSFEQIEPQANEFVDSFYNNLFTATPEAKPLFDTTDMKAQKQKLLNSLVLVVENLRNPEALNGALRGLGARHVKYGALPEHYPLVGSALLTTFGQYLKSDWTPEVKQAWVDAYGAISEIMLDGADYSEAEIALPTPTGEVESAEEVLPVATTTTSVATINKPIALETDRKKITPNPMNSPADVRPHPTSSEPTADYSKAGLFALLGGGILGIIATILILL